MIETTIISYLDSYLNPTPTPEGHVNIFVGMEQPEQLTNYVIVDKTGSSRSNQITTSTFAVQSYGPSLLEALELSKTVEAAMLNIVTLDEVAGVRLETDYNFTDTTTKQYRWQAVYQITHY